MPSNCRLGLVAKAAAVAGLALVAGTAAASLAIAYQDLPTSSAGLQSRHGVGGPVIADDFETARAGTVRRIEWWGTAASSEFWEIVFNTSTAGHPSIDNPFSGGLVKWDSVRAVGVADSASPGLFHYSWDVTGPEYMFVTAETNYWLTIANHATGWDWSFALDGPTIGTESFNAHRSTGVFPGDPTACPDGGPHCGPWTDVHTDFAFRLSVPEPGSAALAGLALLINGFASVLRPRPRSTGHPQLRV